MQRGALQVHLFHRFVAPHVRSRSDPLRSGKFTQLLRDKYIHFTQFGCFSVAPSSAYESREYSQQSLKYHLLALIKDSYIKLMIIVTIYLSWTVTMRDGLSALVRTFYDALATVK